MDLTAKIVGGAVNKYPYYLTDLRKDNPSISFPKNAMELQSIRDEYGLVVVKNTPMPFEKGFKFDNMRPVKQGDDSWLETWDKTAKVWADYFAKTPVKDPRTTWLSEPKILQPLATHVPDGLSIREQVDFLFNNVLRKPELIGSHIWRRTIKDLTYKCTAANTDPNFYFNESHLNNNVRSWTKFTLEDAYGHMATMRELTNKWEKLRSEKLRSMSV